VSIIVFKQTSIAESTGVFMTKLVNLKILNFRAARPIRLLSYSSFV